MSSQAKRSMRLAWSIGSSSSFLIFRASRIISSKSSFFVQDESTPFLISTAITLLSGDESPREVNHKKEEQQCNLMN